jgi:Flp pilus assembly protein TadD
VSPDEALLAQADAALAAGRPDLAEDGYRRLLAARPDHAGALRRFGDLARQRGHLPAALHLLRAALAADPAEGAAWRGLGNTLSRRGDLAAHRAYRRATVAAPFDAESWFDRAVALLDDDHPVTGMAALHRSLALAPGAPATRMMWGVQRLARGDYRGGFAHYAARWEIPSLVPWAAQLRGRRWRGEPLAGKTVLVIGEQGFGDDLMCLRFLPRLKSLGARIVLGLSPPLGPLGRRLADVDVFLNSGDAVPPCDYEIPMFDLPWRLGLAAPADAASPPYLQADPLKVAAWRDRLGPGRVFRIGLAWAGRPSHPHDARRSVTLAALAPLFGLENCEFHSLQLGPAATSAAGTAVIDHQDDLKSFDDTAALMATLDLVITVDSAPAHLAGALGVPVWIMLYAPAEWRWGAAGDRTPWYGGARLFRQRTIGDWGPVVEEIRARLANTLNHQSS